MRPYIFCGDHQLCARQRPSTRMPAPASRGVEHVVQSIRRRGLKVHIILRADSGFCGEGLTAWCEKNRVDYVLGLAHNSRLQRKIAGTMREGKQTTPKYGTTGTILCRVLLTHKKSWSRATCRQS